MSLCRHCIGTIKHGAPRPSIRAVRSLATTSRLQSDTADELRKAKERAWYLEPAPLPNRAEGSRTPAARQSQPRFTTFDPESTRSDISPQSIVPLPDNATDPLLVKLHEHLTTQSDSVDPSTVRFLHPSSSRILQDHGGIEGSLLGESGGTSWQWVVVCQVRGRGRGVVNRAEKEIRKWVSVLSEGTCSGVFLRKDRADEIDAGRARPSHEVENRVSSRERHGLGHGPCRRRRLCQSLHG